MNTHADKAKDTKNQSTANIVSQKKNGNNQTFQFVDNRPEATAKRKLQGMVDNSPQVTQLEQFKSKADVAAAEVQKHLRSKQMQK